ncbi:hypothetical protein [Sporolactobacillus spathodeae]|uniref:Uncharacterized protein n=1 Tax=Sporolactobacillus spathodeae TaxID=1465502 RepID=A0ABS2Q882_9BACL|nr:hypothetical protein [Sporolactobacillus spathodeae]MBM7657989.1 hypothetical protein [Sporolactobacillus spathodeae]
MLKSRRTCDVTHQLDLLLMKTDQMAQKIIRQNCNLVDETVNNYRRTLSMHLTPFLAIDQLAACCGRPIAMAEEKVADKKIYPFTTERKNRRHVPLLTMTDKKIAEE